MKKLSSKAIDRRINAAYTATCSGIQVNIMDLQKIFDVGKASILNGDNDDQLCIKIRALVERIRFN